MDNIKGKIFYMAKYNKVWQHIKTKQVYGNQIELKGNEKISDYKEIPKIKENSDKEKLENMTNLSNKSNLGYNLNKK